MTQEQPAAGTHCVVDACGEPATVFVRITDSDIEGETAVAMCDAHADHWRSNG